MCILTLQMLYQFDFRLTAWRSGMTVLANVLVYVIAWAILNRSDNDMICPDDAYAFKNLMLTCIGIGIAATIGYHLLVKFPIRHSHVLGYIKT